MLVQLEQHVQMDPQFRVLEPIIVRQPLITDMYHVMEELDGQDVLQMPK